MKITKQKLVNIIKEELDAAFDEEGEEATGQNVYVVAMPSETYGGEGVEIRLIGVFLNEAAAMDAVEKLRPISPGTSPYQFAIPANKIDTIGYAG